MKHNIAWFKNRIGKKVRSRRKGKDIEVKILNVEHAKYLLLCQNELNVVYYQNKIK